MTTAELLATPVGFGEIVLKKKFYDWQKEILMDFLSLEKVRVAVSANNEAGKTKWVVAPLAIWYACTFPNSLVIVTASVDRQIKDVIFHELRSYGSLFPKHPPSKEEWNLPNGSRIIGFCTNHAGKFESWHNDHFLLIADEAKTIVPDIFTAFDRCRPTHTLYVSSPGEAAGEFFKAFVDPTHGFKTYKITWKMCPHIKQEDADYIEKKYAHLPEFVKSTLYGEFMENDGTYVITWNMLHELRKSPPLRLSSDRSAFIDFGLGVAETVIATMDGNEVLPLDTYIQSDQEKTVSWAFDKLTEKKVKHVWGDEGVAGEGMFQALKKKLAIANISCNGVMNQKAAYDETHYANRGAEQWYDAKYLIQRREVILPKDDILESQLTTRLKDWDAKDRAAVEKKEDMAERGLPSPDRADAVCGVLSNFRWGYNKLIQSKELDEIDREYNRIEKRAFAIPGGDGGDY